MRKYDRNYREGGGGEAASSTHSTDVVQVARVTVTNVIEFRDGCAYRPRLPSALSLTTSPPVSFHKFSQYHCGRTKVEWIRDGIPDVCISSTSQTTPPSSRVLIPSRRKVIGKRHHSPISDGNDAHSAKLREFPELQRTLGTSCGRDSGNKDMASTSPPAPPFRH